MPSAYSGIGNTPFSPNPTSSATQGMFADFGMGFDALLNQYMPQYGGSNFFDWLSSAGKRMTEDRFNQNNAGILANGGSIFDTQDPLSFLQNFDFAGLFNQQAPRDRGENPSMNTPFLRYLSR